MGFIRFLLKIIALPVMIILTIIVPLLQFLCHYATWLLNIVSGLCFLLGVFAFFDGDKIASCIILAAAFLLSPWGLPAAADWLLGWASEFKFALREFIMS